MSSFADEVMVEAHLCSDEPVLLTKFNGKVDDVYRPERVIQTLEKIYFGFSDDDYDSLRDEIDALMLCAALLRQIDAAMSLEPKVESLIESGLR